MDAPWLFPLNKVMIAMATAHITFANELYAALDSNDQLDPHKLLLLSVYLHGMFLYALENPNTSTKIVVDAMINSKRTIVLGNL
jgi:hypothetical protein